MSVKIQISQKTRTKIEEICKSFNNESGELINVLHKTQDYLGYLPAEAQEVIGQELKIPTAKVYGVVSFYSFFTMIPKGRFPVSICMGTACYVRGAEKVLDELKNLLGLNVGETGADGIFSLASLRCVGACGLAPVVLVGDKVFGRLAADDVKNMVDEYKDLGGAV
jgi:NADH-quinone oxidoreductase subunit E/NADP-reducing hydrogenase subunit HndA